MSGRWLWCYGALAFALSWGWWLPMIAQGQVVRAGQGWPTHLVGLAGPAVAAVVMTAATGGRRALQDLGRRAVRWRVRPLWWLVVAGALLLALLGYAAPLWGGRAPSFRDLGTYSGAPTPDAVHFVLLLAYVLVVNGFGEELGWRGFLAHHLLPRHGRLRSSTVVWVVWATWHLPLFFVVESFRQFGLFTAVGWLAGLWFGSYFLTWLYESAARSVLVVAAWHTAYNFSTATEAAAGAAAAVSSTLVMAVTAFLLVRSARRGADEGTARAVVR